MKILCVNAGSSSLKVSLFRLESDREERAWSLVVDGIGLEQGRLRVAKGDEWIADHARPIADLSEAGDLALRALAEHGVPSPDAIGHRVVHGGPNHADPVAISQALLEELRRLAPLAPLHQPNALKLVELALASFPKAQQVACFDTAFHRLLPEVSQRLPFPASLHDAGVRRYGFHGLSCEFVLTALAPGEEERVVIAHLGSGVSLTATRGRRPIDTTMGMTPTGGVMMGTRSGDLDPGTVLYLERQQGYTTDALDELFNSRSGLVGVSGLSSDMRTLLAARESNAEAGLAVEMFCRRIRLGIGAMAAALGGIDTLVFTGGIGEHQPIVREEICRPLAHIGIELDEQRNASGATSISRASAQCVVRVVEAEEDRVIARQTASLLRA